jgi:iron-sulfur cluster assembly protein
MIDITDEAAFEIRRVWEEQQLPPEAVLRLFVRGGGCSGLQTGLNIEEGYNETTDILQNVSGIRVVVDKKSALYLEGTTVGYHNSLNQRGFTFSNPKIKRTCGCGSSFEPPVG